MRRAAIISILCLVAASCGDSTTTDTTIAAIAATTPTTAPATTAVPPPTTTTLPAITAPPPTAVPVAIEAAPWAEAPLSADAVPEVLVAQWEQSDVKGYCSALYPSGDLPGDATIRSANFSGGWAVAWDMVDGPGRFASGEYCTDCGRGAFGLAGSHRAYGDETQIWGTQVSWTDGSLAGYGYEGLGGGSRGEPHLMYLLVKGEGCLYNVWSFLGEEHLLGMVADLRFVTDMRGQPTGWRIDASADAAQLGEPAWVTEAPLTEDDISDLYVLEWAGEANSPAACPMLAFADLGEAAGATIRRAANIGEMLVAWDLPGAPGHDGGSRPCEDCGRGVVGLGTFLNSTIQDTPITHEWEDGSRAAAFEWFYGTEAHLEPAGFTCMYWLWSHLGPDHLDYLFTQLRRVDGFP